MKVSTRVFAFFLTLAMLPAPAIADYGSSAPKGLSRSTTKSVTRVIERGIRTCTRLDTVYRYDCYRQSYGKAAGKLAGNPAYAEAETALRAVERTLADVVAREADAAADPLRRKGRSYTPIRPAAAAGAKARFRAALDEAETVLLRAAAGSEGDDFARIARAVNSNKVLLKALLRALRLA